MFKNKREGKKPDVNLGTMDHAVKNIQLSKMQMA